jgi:hypothetical protein
MIARRGSRRTWELLFALFVGVVHAAVIAGIVARLDYPVKTFEYVPGGVPGATVGLVAVVAIPVFIVLRYRIVLPILAAIAGAVWPVYQEFTTPPPEFSTLGGYTIIHGTRYVDAYVNGWYVWLLAYLLVGLAEYVVRSDHEWLPSPARTERLEQWTRRDHLAALRLATVVAVAHVAVFLLLAADSGYFAPDGFLPSPWYVGLGVLAWTVLGLLVVGGLPMYLLVRTRLVAPIVVFAWLVRETGWAQNIPLPDDSLPVYFIGWFFFAGVLLVVGSVEYALRLAGQWTGHRPTTG